MARSSFLGMKMVVLLVFLAIPTFAIGHVETTTGDDSLAPLPVPVPAPAPGPLSSSSFSTEGWSKCPRLVPEEVVERVLDHLKVSDHIKAILKESVRFGLCIAGKFCGCFRLRLEPLIFGCFAAIGFVCMKQDCTIACATSIMEANRTSLSDKAIVDFCSNKCMKKV